MISDIKGCFEISKNYTCLISDVKNRVWSEIYKYIKDFVDLYIKEVQEKNVF